LGPLARFAFFSGGGEGLDEGEDGGPAAGNFFTARFPENVSDDACSVCAALATARRVIRRSGILITREATTMILGNLAIKKVYSKFEDAVDVRQVV
jgi:hypothetical protein